MNSSVKDWAGGIGALVGIAAVIALGMGITDKVRSNSYLFVDNASGEPAVVKLDGEPAITVAPRSVGVVYTRHGDRQIRVERGGQSVFEKQVSLESPGFFGVRKYIVNPKQESGYWVRTIVYGTTFNLPHIDDGSGAYTQLARLIPTIGNSEWFLIPADKADYVLTETPPESIDVSDSQKSVTKYQTCRMDRGDYEMIVDAPKKQDIVERDVQAMEAVVKRLFESADKPTP